MAPRDKGIEVSSLVPGKIWYYSGRQNSKMVDVTSGESLRTMYMGDIVYLKRTHHVSLATGD